MSSHCSRYPNCGCSKEIGTKCHLPHGEETVKCECGKEVELSKARMDDDACWYCPECFADASGRPDAS